LRRPRLLIRAARAGLKSYVRDAHLAAILPTAALGERNSVLGHLRAIEAECENARRCRSAEYSLSRHVGILIALLAETALPSGCKASARPG